MSFKGTFFSAVVILLVSIYYNVYVVFKSPPIPVPDESIWWNPNRNVSDTRIRDFKVTICDQEIQDIYHRLNISRYPIKIDDGHQQQLNHEYGMNPNLIKKLATFIQKNYNFAERVEYLNSYPQFITNIQGVDIHFVHIRPAKINQNTIKINILLLHGWPSGPSEFFALVPHFKRHKKYVFEIIIPSIPGFGYSEALGNMHVKNIAPILKMLMKRLQLEQFYVHGSDWGGIIGSAMATLYPNNILGYHSNFCVSSRYIIWVKVLLGSLVPSLSVDEEHRARLYPITNLLQFYVYESGYMHMLGSKPDTIAMGLDNSLEGILAFNLEKWSVGADKNNIYLENGGLDIYELNRLLDIQIFYYWLPRKYSTVARIYSDNLNLKGLMDPVYQATTNTKVPCGCVYFRHEFVYFPKSILKDKFSNLVHYKTYNFGGHFASMEKQTYEKLFQDLLEFINKTNDKTII